MPVARSVLPWVALVVVAALSGALLARALRPDAPPELVAGTWLPAPRVLPDFALVDSDGARFDREALAGRPSVLFFGFTHCPDVCPATLALLANVARRVPAEGPRTHLVSVDPERDTPARLAAYVHAFDPEFIGVTGSPQDIASFARALGVAIARVDLPGGHYTVDHSATIFLLDAEWSTV